MRLGGIVLLMLLALTPVARAQEAAVDLEALAESIDPQRRLTDVALERVDGEMYVVAQGPEGPVRVTPEVYLEALQQRRQMQEEYGLLFTLFNITSWWGVAWVVIGLLGQVLFTGRMVVQWLVSEKHHRSMVPVSFWWLSLIGATMLLMYFTWRKDIVGFIGQATGWLIYVRNLWMIYSPSMPPPKKSVGASDTPAAPNGAP